MHPLLSISIGCFVLYLAPCIPLLPLGLGCLSIYLFLHFASPAVKMSTRRKLMLATWTESREPNIFGVLNINAEPMKKYIEEAKSKGEKVTITTLVAKSLGLAFRRAPSLNCRLFMDKFIPYKNISVSTLVNVDDGKDLAFVTISDIDKKTIRQIGEEVQKRANKLKEHKDEDFNKTKPLLKMLPVFLLRPLVEFTGYLSSACNLSIPPLGVRPAPFGTAVITSVGMMGIEQGFAPFTPFARVPLLLMIGSMEKRPVVHDDQVVIQNQISITATIDHRYIDGADIAHLAKELRKWLERPDELDAAGYAESKDSSKP